MLVILITGAPGCGKGTQSQLLVEKYQLTHLSTGDLLRKETKSGSQLGNFINSYISKGNLVPDETIIELLDKHIDTLDFANSKGIILDGFPRTLPQAKALEVMMNEKEMPTTIMVDVAVEEAELIQRLLKRGEISGRSDDNLETITERLKIYHSQTTPIYDHYKELSKYAAINGMGSIEDIFERITTEIDKVK